jgi:Na+/melibiose symporter-like transporter
MFGFEGFTAVLIVGTMLLFFQPFATGVLGLAPAVPGLIFAATLICALFYVFRFEASRITSLQTGKLHAKECKMVVDAFTDPLFGVLVDKRKLLKSRKYTPWYYLGVIVLCAGAVGVFWNPGLESAMAMT